MSTTATVVSRRRVVIDRLRLGGYLTGWRAVRTLPAGAAYRAFRLFADVAWRRRVKSVVRLEQNLRRVVPGISDHDLRALSREGMRSYFRYWCDAFRMEDWSVDEIVSRTVITDRHYIDEALEQGMGVVAPLPHMANWDWAGAWACQVLTPLATVAERLRPPELYDRFVAYRESLGMTVWPLTDSPVDPMQALGDHLRAGKMVCLPAERDLSQRGVTVTFFGEKTRMPAGPAVLHLRTGAPIVPVTLSYEGVEPHHRLHVRFHPPVSIESVTSGRIQEITQQVADTFETGISDDPQDWHMLQRLFLADLDPDHPRAQETTT